MRENRGSLAMRPASRAGFQPAWQTHEIEQLQSSPVRHHRGGRQDARPAFSFMKREIPLSTNGALSTVRVTHMKKSVKSAFPNIPRIQYEGARSKNPLAFKQYNPDEVVEGKAMKDHLRFSVVYWHTM